MFRQIIQHHCIFLVTVPKEITTMVFGVSQYTNENTSHNPF